MKTGKRNVFNDNYPITENKFDLIADEVEKMKQRLDGLSSILAEVKANTNNLRASTNFEDDPIHGEANKAMIDLLNSLRDARTTFLPLEKDVRKARANSRKAVSTHLKGK